MGQISLPPQKNMTLLVIGRVKFERNCGKMYSRHLFPYGRLTGLNCMYKRLMDLHTDCITV